MLPRTLEDGSLRVRSISLEAGFNIQGRNSRRNYLSGACFSSLFIAWKDLHSLSTPVCNSSRDGEPNSACLIQSNARLPFVLSFAAINCVKGPAYALERSIVVAGLFHFLWFLKILSNFGLGIPQQRKVQNRAIRGRITRPEASWNKRHDSTNEGPKARKSWLNPLTACAQWP